MTGFNFPDCIMSAKMVRSFPFASAIIIPIFWLVNGDKTIVLITRPNGPTHRLSLGPPPPIMTYFPLGVKMRLHSESEWFGTLSRITS